MKAKFSTLIFILFLTSCDVQKDLVTNPVQIQNKILNDKDFVEMIGLGIHLKESVEELQLTYAASKIDEILVDQLLIIRDKFNTLNKRYIDFDYNAKIVAGSVEFQVKLENYLKTKRISAGKVGLFEGVCNYTTGPCGPGGSSVNHVTSCMTGCVYSQIACIQQNGGTEFCSSVRTSCNGSCCGACVIIPE